MRVNPERMHRVIAGERKPGDYDLGRRIRRGCARRQRVAHDAIVCFRVERPIVERDPGSPGIAALGAGSKSGDHISAALTLGVLQSHQESARRWRVVAIIAPAPGGHVQYPIWAERHLSRVADVVGEYGCAETGWQRDAAIVTRTGQDRCGRVVALLRKQRRWSKQQHSHHAQRHRHARGYLTTAQSSMSHEVYPSSEMYSSSH